MKQPNIHPYSARVWINYLEITTGLRAVEVRFESDDVTKAVLHLDVDWLDLDQRTVAVLEAHVAATTEDDES
jgi:hypothetical protein